MDRAAQSVIVETTMLELVSTLAAELEDEREVVHIVQQMIAAGRVRLLGTFRDEFREIRIEEPGSHAPREGRVLRAPRSRSAAPIRAARSARHGEGDRP